jgi:predicted acyltransferase
MDPANPRASAGRLTSIDALRGFDMFWIVGGEWIFQGLLKGLEKGCSCNWLSGLAPQMKHMPWEGFHFMDLIMPLFLFVAGVSMPFSYAKRLASDGSKGRLYVHIAKRTVILFILGMVAQGNLLAFDLDKLKLFSNTLQAIATGSLIASVILLNLGIRWQLVTTAALLLGYWALLSWVPVPGHGAGVLTAEGNLAIWLDHLILGRFQDGTPYTWILSSMSFACTVMLGVFSGELLRSGARPSVKCVWLLAAGTGCIVLGLVWARWFPIIKHLWTSSFVLFSGGISLVLLGVFYLIIDVWAWKKWAFVFTVLGTNAIAVYMARQLYDFRRLSDVFVKGLTPHVGPWDDLLRGTAGFILAWLVLYWMYRKKSFVKI